VSIYKISRDIVYALRHKPEKFNLQLDKAGWTDVSTLVNEVQKEYEGFDLFMLNIIVTTNDKRRLVFNEDQTKIRATQGHSIDVDLGYEPVRPPAYLYHGTPETNVNSIMKSGLNKGTRHHVHLSPDVQTARQVGSRRGKAVILVILSGLMYADGYKFYMSTNGVWLTDEVPPKYITKYENSK
jgi:putative RNA 2'-phosphotransferase